MEKNEQFCAERQPSALSSIDIFGWLAGRRRVSRGRRIVAVLMRYGFAELAARLGMPSGFRMRRGTRRDIASLSEPERLVKALEELGPTFIKLGQVLSTRPDILPKDYLTALTRLQDNVTRLPFTDVERVIQRALCCPLSDVFSEFNPVPVAAASLSQVHRARLKDGTDVAVKVQRPGITDGITADLDILAGAARFAEKRLPDFAAYDPVAIVEEFSRSLKSELDFVHEGQNADICRAKFGSDPTVFIPKVYWEHSTSRVLIMDFLDGTKVTNLAELASIGVDRRQLAVRGCAVYMKMIFDHSFFQPDPHPGNLVVLADGRIGIFDFGMFSRIDDDIHDLLVDLLIATWHRDATKLAQLIIRGGASTGHVDEAALRTDVGDLIERYYGADISELSVGRMLEELMPLIHRHHIHLPPRLAMLVRGLATVEGLGLLVDPDFNFTREMSPHVERVALKRFGPLGWLKSLRRSRTEIDALFRTLPTDLRHIIDGLKRGEIKLRIDQDELQDMFKNVGRANNRLSVAIVLAALIVSSTLLIINSPTGVHGIIPSIGVAGFIISGIVAILLLLSAIRGGWF